MKGFKKWLERKCIAIQKRKDLQWFDDYTFIIILLVIAISFIFYVANAN
jgi:hypothetical protein